MILSNIKNYKQILKMLPELKIVFSFLTKKITAKTPDGKYNITKDIYAIVSNSQPKPKKEQLLEAHRKYIDLQYVICGVDNIGWKFLDKTFKVYTRYNNKKDIAFYKNKPDIFIKLKKNDFAIFFPQDTHAPLCNVKPVKKCIVKIPVSF